MDREGFRGPQVCSIVGITYRQLDYWDRTGLSRPSLAPARGSGSQRLYGYRDLLELKVIKQLLDAGVNLRQARRAIDCLRESVGEDLTTANLVLVGEGSVLARTGEEIIDLLRGGQGVFNVVPLAGVVGEVDAAILRIDAARGAAGAAAPAGSQHGGAPGTIAAPGASRFVEGG
jgi:DNA-binding transcriptional MerR regulator